MRREKHRRTRWVCLAIAPQVLLLRLGSAARGGDVAAIWDGSDNNWSSAADWSSNPYYPDNGNPAGTTYDAQISSGQVTLDVNPTVDSLELTGATLTSVDGNETLTVGASTTLSGGQVMYVSVDAQGGLAFDSSDQCELTFGGVLTNDVNSTATMGATSPGLGIDGTSTFTNAGTMNVSGGELEAVSSYGGIVNNSGTMNVNVPAASFSIGRGLSFNNSGQVSVQAGELQVGWEYMGTGAGSFSVSPGATLVLQNSFTQTASMQNDGLVRVQSSGSIGGVTGSGSLEIDSGTLSFYPNGNVSTVSALTIDSGAAFNVGGFGNELVINAATANALQILGSGQLNVNNELLIHYVPGVDPITTIAAYLTSGYNGGNWNGPGIMSTYAQAPINGLDYALGFADSADAGNPAGLAADTIEVKFTLVGDLNLNGIVDGIDFAALARNFNTFNSDWDAGDVLYHNGVDGLDFAQFAKNFGQTADGNPIILGPADWAAFDALAREIGDTPEIPEPASLGLLGIAGLLLMRRPGASLRG